jgi:peptidoglycan hydrolase-like protein with peptidoglycan-binding domain
MTWSPNHSSRGGATVKYVVIHTAEGARTAASLGNFFANPSVQASSHVGIDNNTTEQYVSYDRAAWTLLNGNPSSDNAELCGFAAWSRDEWFRNQGMLDRAAQWIADRCRARGIPIRKLTPAQIDAGWSGVIGHIDWSQSAIGQGDHWDPGYNFPWDYVIQKAQGLNPTPGGGSGGGGGGGTPTPPATTFPISRNEYFGLITGPDESHGGANESERVWVKQIQQALQAKGFAPKDAGWADGVFEQPTKDAVAAWQKANMPGTTRFGEVWWDDWEALIQGKSGSNPAPAPNPTPPSNVPAFPLPQNHYFGLITGPNESHGGYYANERAWVKLIQEALQRKGFAPNNTEWADGKYEQPTKDAVAAWQRATMPGTTRFGEVWWDDWAQLLK